MEDKFILISMNDPRSKKIAEVMQSATCKKMIDFLEKENEASAKDFSDGLNIPMNTTDYNLKKLLESELIQKKKKFFWSSKGKRIVLYKLSNKSIIISPKNSNIESKLKSILPSIFITSALTFAIYTYEKINAGKNTLGETFDMAAPSASNSFYESGIMGETAKIAIGNTGNIPLVSSPIWMWFLAGSLLSVLIFSIINWKKI